MKHWISPFPSYQGYRHGMGAGYIRYDHDITWYTPGEILGGTAITHLEHHGQLARDDQAFYGTRLIWNHVDSNRALPGCKVIEFVHPDGQRAFVCDVRHHDTLELMMEVEQLEADAVGYLRDFRQFGFGILNENNFFGHECPFTTDEIVEYYTRMKAVWHRKLMVCVGGDPSYMHPLLEWLGKQGDERPQAVFQDEFGTDGWSPAPGCPPLEGGNMYTRAEIALGYKPLVWWCETTGEANEIPDDRIACLFTQFVKERGVFFANMGEKPAYAGAAEFSEEVGEYAPARLRQFLEWSAADSSSGESGGVRASGIEAELSRLRAQVDTLTRTNAELSERVDELEGLRSGEAPD